MRLKSGGGRRALNSTESTSRDGCQGGLWGAGDALQPAGGGVAPAWARTSPAALGAATGGAQSTQ